MKAGRHPPDLPVFPFAENEIVMACSPRKDRFRPEPLAALGHPFAGQLPDRARIQLARQAHPVGLFHFIPRMGQVRHKIAVVGKQDQPLAVLVQPSGRDQPHLFCLRDQVHRFACGVAVFQRAHIAPGLVQHDIQFLRRGRDLLAVEGHPVARQDPHRAAVRRRAVDQHPPRADQRIRSPPGTYARGAQIFRQADPVRSHFVRRGQFLPA